ncbi:MAG: putative transport system permease protein, partial [Streptomyces sp.]|nr:putative transport system permease protein [Streptomyces sp.]
GRFHAWRVAVRIARRDAWRSKGRSLMVLAMIALPIMAVSAADITIRSSQLTTGEWLTRDIGAADARLSSANMGSQAILQNPSGDDTDTVHQQEDDTADDTVDTDYRVDPKVALPAGARWLTDETTYAGIRTKTGLLYTVVRELNAGDPIAAGIMRLDRGRFPAAPDEMVATNAFLDSSGLHVGSKVSAYGLSRGYRIVGAYDLPNGLDTEQLDALPGAFIAPYLAERTAAGADAGVLDAATYLVSVPGDFSWDMVQRANTLGVVVESRSVRLHPPADSEVPLYVRHGGPYDSVSGDTRAGVLSAAATIVGLAILEICLLAGPAFAVGARRSRRQLGLVGANGGDRRHIRAIVLSSGLVIGAGAAVIGTVLGLTLTVALRGVLENYVGQRFGGITVRPLELLGIAALAVFTGLMAAVVPAISSSRQSVLSSLTGRRGVRHANRILPVIGLGAVCLGGGVAVFGSLRTDNTLAVAGGSALAELGIVALAPTLVGAFGRLGRWLPVGPRLALRDAVRNRGRTAPAVAAVLAAVAGTVAVTTYAAGHDRQDRDSYEARAPLGVYALSIPSSQGRDLGTARAAVEKRFPVSGRADVSRLVVGKRVCDLYSSQPGCGEVEPVVPKANVCLRDVAADTAVFTPAQLRSFASDWRCESRDMPPPIDSEGSVLVGGPAVLHALGIHDGAAERALARGETVLFDRTYLDHGALDLQLTLDKSKEQYDEDPTGPVKALPAMLSTAHLPYGLLAVVPQQAAVDAGLRTVPLGSFFTTSRMPTGAEQQALTGDLAKLGTDTQTYLERGYTSENNLVLLALTLLAGVVTIGAAGIATGLAQADAEPDQRTLAAVGASPRVRRVLAGFQCGVIATMGVVLGTAAGILPAVGLRRAERQQAWSEYHSAIDGGWGSVSDIPHVPIVMPWGSFALLLVGVPVGAMLLAALVTRSRTEMARRAEA